jgi:hypothetical protein
LKEDVLEQIVEDYLQMEGYFTTHNVKFKPSPDHPEFNLRADSVASDVDVLGYSPRKEDPERVVVVSCKAWQSGFAADRILAQLYGRAPNPKRETWLSLRELWSEKWAAGFVAEIERLTGTDRFTYYLAVTRLSGDPTAWENDRRIRKNLKGNPLKFLTLEEMWTRVVDTVAKTPASSEMGRLALWADMRRLVAARLVNRPERGSNSRGLPKRVTGGRSAS